MDEQAGAGALEALRVIRGERRSLDRREYAQIQSARALGVTWQRIGRALGYRSPQAGHQWYKVLAKRVSP